MICARGLSAREHFGDLLAGAHVMRERDAAKARARRGQCRRNVLGELVERIDGESGPGGVEETHLR